MQEIASNLNIPRHFLAKVMKRLVKEDILASVKGHAGGFSINRETHTTTLLRIAQVTGESEAPDKCILHLGTCDTNDPCALHVRTADIKKDWHELLRTTTIADLVREIQLRDSQEAARAY